MIIKTVYIGLNNSCNLKCPMCTRQMTNHIFDNTYININNIIRFLDILKDLETIEIAGTVSEPTLYPHLFKLIKYLKSRNIFIIISTNGSTRNIKWWSKLGLMLDNNDEVIFAIDGSTQDIHQKYRVGSNLSKVLLNHKVFKQNSECKTTCQFIKFNYNQNDILNTMSLSF